MSPKDLTPYQQGIVNRYYDNKDDIMNQKLAEIVSDLSVCEDETKVKRLWKSADKALENAGAPKARRKRLIKNRDLEDLAALIGEMF
ncbi:MAG: hypothetical protein ACOCR1_04995 [Planctomycetota bacterium]